MNLYRYKNHVYVPILKNASTTYINFFVKSNWEEISENDVRKDLSLKLFGHIQDPNVRHTKGVAEIIYERGYESYLKDEKLAILLCSGLYDLHTFPLGCIFGDDLIFRTHWIPMDLVFNGNKISSHDLTNFYFKDNNLPFKISHYDDTNISGDVKKAIQHNVKEIKEKYHEKIYDWLKTGVLRRDPWIWNEAKNYYINYLTCQKTNEENN